MGGFAVLTSLTSNIILSFFLQMLSITVVVRGLIAGAMRLISGSWHGRTDLIIAAHALALLAFAAMTDFVEAGAPPASFAGALLHSLAVLWPLQIPLLIADLAIHAGLARKKAA